MKKTALLQFSYALVILLFVSCGSDSDSTPNDESEISSFTVLDVDGVISREAGEISVILPENTDITAVSPTISISDGATVNPASGSEQDFTNSITYTVTAEDGSTTIFRVTVATEIFPFTFEGRRYEVVKRERSWTEAVDFAVARGGHLAEINTVMEQAAVVAGLSDANIVVSTLVATNSVTNPIPEVWLGGRDIDQDGTSVWIFDGDNDGVGIEFWIGDFSGMAVNDQFTNWGANEPDGAPGLNAQTILIADGSFNTEREWNDRDTDFLTLFSVIEFEE